MGSFCTGIARLLVGVNEQGSIYLTARQQKMAYSTAWKRLAAAERALGCDLLIRDGARGSKLSPEGGKLLNAYQKIEDATSKLANEMLMELMEN
jgi:molybdate transport system regulatory protein